MDDNILQLELLSLQNSLASSLNGSSSNVLTTSSKENYIKELEIKVAKLEVNVSTYAEKIKDKDEVIAALKMTIAFCKNDNYNNGSKNNNNESSSRLNELQASLHNKDKQLANLKSQVREYDIRFQESEAKSVCLANQIDQLKVHLHEYEGMIKSTPNSNHLLLESRQLIHARDLHINELREVIKSKEAQMVLQELKLQDQAKDDALPAKHEEKTQLLASQEEIIKEQTNNIAKLQAQIEQKDEKQKETEQMLANCKAQLKEKNDMQTEKLLKDAKVKINGYTNTIKQLKQNITDLQTGATISKAENVAQQKTIKKLQANVGRMVIEADIQAQRDNTGVISIKCNAGWNLFYRVTAVSEMYNSLVNLNFDTSAYPHEMYVHLTDFNGNNYRAHYDIFVVGSKAEEYKLKKLGKYTGDAGDGMRSCVGNDFRMVEFITLGPLRKRLFRCWGLVTDDESEDCNMYARTTPESANILSWMGKKYKIAIMFFRPKIDNNKIYGSE
ncbi:tropomyosin-like [Drosophila tropicalis]|uniref:tropomyosin-like n=1 Tax=Drosophila tropicalis TaxID=46794 RepID=UPI0035ABDE3A